MQPGLIGAQHQKGIAGGEKSTGNPSFDAAEKNGIEKTERISVRLHLWWLK